MSIIVSADSHFNEPIDFYAPAHRRFGDVVPHVEFGDSGDFWASGSFKRPLGVMNRPGQRGRGNTENLKFSDTEWFTDLSSRKEHVSRDGVSGEVLFPSGAMLYTIEHPQARLECMHLLNEFMSDLNGFYQGVLILPSDPGGALEMLDIFGTSHNCFLLPLYTSSAAYFESEWNPVFERIESSGGVVAFHAGTLDPNMRMLPNHPIAQTQVFKTSRLFFQAHHLLLELVLGGVFSRFPSLQIIISELGASWVPYTIHRLTEGNAIYQEFDITEQEVSDILLNNFSFTVQFDFPSFEASNMKFVSQDNVLFGTDFPHVESTYGKTAEVMVAIENKYGPAVGAKILSSNTLEKFKKLEIKNV